MMASTPTMRTETGWGARDITCFTVALAVHALLLLWKGGIFVLPNTTTPENVLVKVDFMSDVPAYQAPAAPAPKQSLLSKMKSLIKGETFTPKPVTDVFSKKPAATQPADALALAKGQTKEATPLVTEQPVFKDTQPKLKENTFKLATKDAPFKIATAKDQDALANTNMIPIQVGQKTTLSSRAFDNAKMPALQSKTFAGRAGGSEALAMGSASAPQTPALSSSNNSNSAALAGSARATNREFTEHTNAFAGNRMETLSRNTVSPFNGPADSSKSNNSKSSNFNITGALAHRPIVQKTLAAYEMDARVALRFRVDWSGRVLDGILVEISSGSPSFDQKVVAALKQWTFSRLSADRANEIQEGVITFVFKGV
jgi:TonB family protein